MHDYDEAAITFMLSSRLFMTYSWTNLALHKVTFVTCVDIHMYTRYYIQPLHACNIISTCMLLSYRPSTHGPLHDKSSQEEVNQ